MYLSHIVIFETFLNKVKPSATELVFFMGDFNLPHIEWIPDDDAPNVLLPTHLNSNLEIELMDWMLSYNFEQLNNVLNFRERILDLIFCSNSDFCSVLKCDNPIISIDVEHIPIDIIVDIVSTDNSLALGLNLIRDFKNTNYDGLNSFLLSVNWNYLLDKVETNRALDLFYDVLLIGFDYFVPNKIIKLNFSNDIRILNV